MTLFPRSLALGAVLAAVLAAGAPLPGAAQNMFAPAATVDETVVTAFEVDQRQKLLQLFNAPDATRDKALSDLIDERLQLAEARRAGIEVTRQEVLDGMTEFAGRANLTREAFVAQIARGGVDVTTFEDFVRAGVAWRQVVRARFGDTTRIEEDEVERAADAPPAPRLRVLLNELIIPANTPDRAARAQSLAPQISSITSFDAFAAAAREYSATPSRTRGGRIDWLELANLPPQLGQAILALEPGQVTAPIPLPNALAFFQLRQVDEIVPQGVPTSIDYAAYDIPGGRSPQALAEAARIDARVDTCDDLYAVAQGADPARLRRDSRPVAEIPSDVALELARLDPGEVSTGLTRADGQTLVLLMLCGRSYRAADAEAPNLGQVRNALVQRRVGRRADNLLAELRANATIVRQ
ncbi:peptidylprolyl isomerase [Palleronia rufa]|uniref:peptidylprolyl isomerase n=1 Tax=Palleronia rufa TaxID=1530186 RepID=UPI00056D6014|nr:peptidylprolyl isomerase [Palleronia rufa]